MNTPPILTAQQSKTLLAFHKTSKLGETKYLNPANPVHRKFIEIMLGAAGRSNLTFPHLYKALDSSQEFKGNQDLDKVHLVDAGQTTSGKATVTIWSRSSGNTLIKTDNIIVFDSDSGRLLAHGKNSAVRCGFLHCPTHSKLAEQAGKSLSLIHLGHVTETDGTSRFFSFASKVAVAKDSIQITITDPVINEKKDPQNTCVNIGVARAGYGYPSNTDYWYGEVEDEKPDSAYPIVPFTGNANLNGSIDIQALTAANLSTAIFLNNGDGGTIEIIRDQEYTPDSKFLKAFSVGDHPNNLKWSFLCDNAGYKSTNSIVYEKTNLLKAVDSFFSFTFNGIPFQDGSVAPPFYVCSKGYASNEPSSRCFQISNLSFWNHCLAKGTLITLEDGTLKPIEELNEKSRVKSGIEGKGLAVWATVRGRHRAEFKNGQSDIYRITTANGKCITATEEHLVFLSAVRCKSIADLQIGNRIITEDGLSSVKTKVPLAYDDMFFNLALGNLDEQASPDFPHNRAGFYAGGILCGDQQAKHHHLVKWNEDLKYMLPRINPELRQDYTSALKQKR